MEITSYSGYVYKLDDNRISVYGSFGIALRLTERHLSVIAKDLISNRKTKYQDQKGQQFTVELKGECLVFDIKNDEIVTVVGNLLYPCIGEAEAA